MQCGSITCHSPLAICYPLPSQLADLTICRQVSARQEHCPPNPFRPSSHSFHQACANIAAVKAGL
jgi:hypothetical protein